jgi:AbrB family looped-hinge helix DNA binding protein
MLLSKVILYIISYFIYIYDMSYVTMTVKGQITVPVEIRRSLGLVPGKKLNIFLQGDNIMIQKPAAVEAVRQRLQTEMKRQGTGTVKTESGSGWEAHVEDRFAQS